MTEEQSILKKKVTQQSKVRSEIIRLINSGMTNKFAIFTTVVQNLQVPRPTVRRCARELIIELEYKIKVLKDQVGEKTI